MTDKERSRRTYSDEARERMRAAALVRYDAGAQQIHERVRTIMTTILQEIANNQGIYPNNKGAISLAEVARRAQIHPFTFHKPRYVELIKEVREWLASLKQEVLVGRTRVRKELSARAHEWKLLYGDLLEVHHVSETDLHHTQLLLDEALKKNEELQQRNQELLQTLTNLNKQKLKVLRPKKGLI